MLPPSFAFLTNPSFLPPVTKQTPEFHQHTCICTTADWTVKVVRDLLWHLMALLLLSFVFSPQTLGKWLSSTHITPVYTGLHNVYFLCKDADSQFPSACECGPWSGQSIRSLLGPSWGSFLSGMVSSGWGFHWRLAVHCWSRTLSPSGDSCQPILSLLLPNLQAEMHIKYMSRAHRDRGKTEEKKFWTHGRRMILMTSGSST